MCMWTVCVAKINVLTSLSNIFNFIIQETESKAAIRTAWKTPPLTPPNSSVYSQKSYGETQSLLSDTDSKLSQHLHSGRHSHTMAANFTGQKMERADTHLLK